MKTKITILLTLFSAGLLLHSAEKKTITPQWNPKKDAIRFTLQKFPLSILYPQINCSEFPQQVAVEKGIVQLKYKSGVTGKITFAKDELLFDFQNTQKIGSLKFFLWIGKAISQGGKVSLSADKILPFPILGKSGKHVFDGTFSGKFTLMTAHRFNQVFEFDFSGNKPRKKPFLEIIPGWHQSVGHSFLFGILLYPTPQKGLQFKLKIKEAPAIQKNAGKTVVIDRFGQLVQKDFKDKVRSEEELRNDLKADRIYYASLNPPKRSLWGGDPVKKKFKGNGFFAVTEYNKRKVLLDPEGNPFFQLGVCMIGNCDDYTFITGRKSIYEFIPERNGLFEGAYLKGQPGENFSFYIANVIRKTGKKYDPGLWQREMIFRLKKWGFNSHGGFGGSGKNNLDLCFASCPFLPVEYGYRKIGNHIFDPFDEKNIPLLEQNFRKVLANYANRKDIIGFFSGNERHYSGIVPAMLKSGKFTEAKRAFLRMMKTKYKTLPRFQKSWPDAAGIVNWDALEKHSLNVRTPEAEKDIRSFEYELFSRYFSLIRKTMKKYDPNHLYLGERFLVAETFCESATRACAENTDIFSINYYTASFDPDFMDALAKKTNRPILLSEWSYGSEEQGLFGVVNLPDEKLRALAYRRYVENAAAHPAVVGVQYFELLDQSATGRWFQKYNGESMSTGLLNVADRPYKTFLDGVMKSNYRIYDLMEGKVKPIALGGNRKRSDIKLIQVPRIGSEHRFDCSLTGWPTRPSEALVYSVEGRKPEKYQRADFRCAWDKDFLYIHAVVQDKTPAQNPHSSGELWIGDAVEVFFGKDLKQQGHLLYNDRHLILAATEPLKYRWYGITQPGKTQICKKFVIAPDRKSYTIEFAVPWKALGVQPKTGDRFCFDLALDFGGTINKRENQLMWNGRKENNLIRTYWGRIVLVP